MLFLQERAGGRREYGVTVSLRPWFRGYFLVQGVALALLGLGFGFAWSAFDGLWPWPLNRLAAGAIGSWLVGIAAGSLRALREGDRRRIRLLLPTYVFFAALQLVDVARFSDRVTAGGRLWLYLGWWRLTLALVALAWRQHEKGKPE